MLSVGLRWPLWKDHLTPKGAATHKVENCCLGASRFLLHSFWYCTTVSGYSFHFYIEKQALGSPMVSPASLPWVALTSSGSNHPKNWGCYRREGSGFTHLHPFLSQSSLYQMLGNMAQPLPAIPLKGWWREVGMVWEIMWAEQKGQPLQKPAEVTCPPPQRRNASLCALLRSPVLIWLRQRWLAPHSFVFNVWNGHNVLQFHHF